MEELCNNSTKQRVRNEICLGLLTFQEKPHSPLEFWNEATGTTVVFDEGTILTCFEDGVSRVAGGSLSISMLQRSTREINPFQNWVN